MANATQIVIGYRKFFCELIEQEPGIYNKRNPDCDRRHKSVSMQITEQELGIYTKRLP
jgi:hypothetical protein